MNVQKQEWQIPYRESGARKFPATKHRLRGVKCTLVMGVLLVGNVARRSDLMVMSISMAWAMLHGTNVSLLSSSIVRVIVDSATPLSRDLPGPPAPLTSQQRTVQSAPPLTSIDDSALNEREYTDAVCPVIFLIRRPEPRSQRFIARSSPALARYRPSGLIASVERLP